jgi:hypothetical protein
VRWCATAGFAKRYLREQVKLVRQFIVRNQYYLSRKADLSMPDVPMPQHTILRPAHLNIEEWLMKGGDFGKKLLSQAEGEKNVKQTAKPSKPRSEANEPARLKLKLCMGCTVSVARENPAAPHYRSRGVAWNEESWVREWELSEAC